MLNQDAVDQVVSEAVEVTDEHLAETVRQIEELAEDRAKKLEATPTRENPLLINRVKKNDKNGGLDFTLSLSKEQTYVLLNFAIMFLASQGLAQFVDSETIPEGQEVILGDQIH